MRKPNKRVIVTSGLVLLALTAIPLGLWVSITHKPKFYQALVAPAKHEDLEAEAKKFVAQSLQLRNDIANEPTWEAIFSDREVNAWLAEDLIAHFADQLPPEIHEPRIAFEADRVTLAFGLDQGPIRSVIWVVARARVPEDNTVALTLEKIRAGALPVSPDRIVKTLTAQAKKNGLDIVWTRDGDFPVATIRYRPDRVRTDVVLERLSIRDGQIRLSGRSNRATAAAPRLPTGRVLQLNFPKRKDHDDSSPAPEAGPGSERNSTGPTS